MPELRNELRYGNLTDVSYTLDHVVQPDDTTSLQCALTNTITQLVATQAALLELTMRVKMLEDSKDEIR